MESLITPHMEKHRQNKSEGMNKMSAQKKKIIRNEAKIVGKEALVFLLSARSGSRGRHMSVNLRPASFT